MSAYETNHTVSYFDSMNTYETSGPQNTTEVITYNPANVYQGKNSIWKNIHQMKNIIKIKKGYLNTNRL